MASDGTKIALFIDGPNLHATAKALGFEVDYRRLLEEFQTHGRLVRAFYYTIVVEDQDSFSVRPLVDFLDYNGFTVVTKPAKDSIDLNGRRNIKGNMNIELAVDAMAIAEHVDGIVLFSGNGDFRSLVEAVQRRVVYVTLRSPRSSHLPFMTVFLSGQSGELN